MGINALFYDMTNLDPEITRKIEEQKRLGGINVSCLESGNRIEVETLNNVYKMELLEDGQIQVSGGIIEDKVIGRFNGSTWGTSLLKQNWIGKGMRMEIAYGDKILSTSPVQKAKVIGDVWLYELWND